MSKTEYEQTLDANLDEWTIDELAEYLEENCEEAELDLIFRAIELLQEYLCNSFEFASELHLYETLLRLSQKEIHDIFQLIFNDLEPPEETVEAINAAVAGELPEVSPDVDVEAVQQWLMLKLAVVFEVFRVPFIVQDFEEERIKSPEDWAEIQWNLAYDYFENIQQNKQEIIERVIHHYQEALTIHTKKIYPENWAIIQNNLAAAYINRIEGEKWENLELALFHCQEALTIDTKDCYPKDWANTQYNLAGVYANRIQGKKRENLELAVYHYREALTVRTKEAYPEDWAVTQNNLANVYSNRIEGERRENLELAIFLYQQALTVRTKEAFPEDWATTQYNLAIAYSDRIEGERRENLECAIFHYQQALTVRTKDAFPEDWATTQNNLANTYSDRIEGERRENLELAIFQYQQALTVSTKEAFPEDWAMTQNNLALAYSNRIEGERRENLELAIFHSQQALTVRIKEAFPEDWAMTQNNLALAYSNRIEGERRENIERAIYHYQQAFTIYTKEAFPEYWAGTQNNLALAYSNRIEGERRENLELAIFHCQQALMVRTKEAFPEQWAMTQHNLASAYSDRIEGERQENLERAIFHCQQALTIRTKETFPHDCLNSSSFLGDLYLQQEDLQKAIEVYQTAIECIELLTTWATDDDYKQQIMAENITVYDNIIQACVALGKYDEAIGYAERGRSRRLVELIASNDLYTDAKIPPEIQDYLARYEAIERQLHNLLQEDSSDGSIGERGLGRFRQTTLTPEEREAKTAEIQTLQAEKQTLWREIRCFDPVIAQQIQVEAISFEEIAALLPNPQSAILSIYNTGAETHIFVIRHPATSPTKSGLFSLFQQLNKPRPVISLHSCPDLTYRKLEELLTEQWLVPYQENSQYWCQAMGQNLQNIAQALQLEQLIQEHLTGIQELIIIPHLGFHHIPFAALPTGEAIATQTEQTLDNTRIKIKSKTRVQTIQNLLHEQYLGDLFQIRVLPSCQILKYCHDRPPLPQTNYGIVENTQEDLKFTHIEANRLKQLEPVLPENHLKGKAEATVSNYQDLLTRVENVHSSHHAKSDLNNPRESALELGDGKFSLGSLMLKRYPNLNHVFLSCCETNLGKPELTDDLLTLGTGFLCAGARTVISSLWAVDDRATAIFTSYYYAALKETQKPALALQKAQQRLRKATVAEICQEFPELEESMDLRKPENRPYAAPFWWGAFICQGV